MDESSVNDQPINVVEIHLKLVVFSDCLNQRSE
jgi:hypothetical protein